MTKKEELLKLIEKSSLPKEDKKLWQGVLEGAPNEIILAMYLFFVDYDGKLEEATTFLRRKIEAVKNKDVSAWNSVLREEEKLIPHSKRS